jgi:hypothetical protein
MYEAPASLPDMATVKRLGNDNVLQVMRERRRKLGSDPRSSSLAFSAYVLKREQRGDFPVEYDLSVNVYTDVVDHILCVTKRLDVLCDCIHFPAHQDSFDLPSWVPDWSYIPARRLSDWRATFRPRGRPRPTGEMSIVAGTCSR